MSSCRTLAAALALVLVTGAWVSAQEWPDRRGAGHGSMLSDLVKGAGLTEPQQAQVRQIVAAHRAQFLSLVGQLRAAREALDARLYAPEPVTAADLAPAVQQISQIRGQLMQESLKVALEVRAILTPEQRAKAAQYHQRLTDLDREMRQLTGSAGR